MEISIPFSLVAKLCRLPIVVLFVTILGALPVLCSADHIVLVGDSLGRRTASQVGHWTGGTNVEGYSSRCAASLVVSSFTITSGHFNSGAYTSVYSIIDRLQIQLGGSY